MKKLAIVIAASAAAVFAPNAFAQAKNFQGFSVGADLNLSKSDAQYLTSGSSTSTNLEVNAQYVLALDAKFVFGVGAFASLNDRNIASDAKQKYKTGFFITPGYAVKNNLLVYGKAGIVTGAYSVDESRVVGHNGTAQNGTIVGIGAKTFIDKKIFLQAEIAQNQYDDKKSREDRVAKLKTTDLTFGVGYKF